MVSCDGVLVEPDGRREMRLAFFTLAFFSGTLHRPLRWPRLPSLITSSQESSEQEVSEEKDPTLSWSAKGGGQWVHHQRASDARHGLQLGDVVHQKRRQTRAANLRRRHTAELTACRVPRVPRAPAARGRGVRPHDQPEGGFHGVSYRSMRNTSPPPAQIPQLVTKTSPPRTNAKLVGKDRSLKRTVFEPSGFKRRSAPNGVPVVARLL
jgi:hypothetical protein